MRTQIRYLRVDEEYVGWYEPAHFVLPANAQLLARRFPELRVAILTPDASAFWTDGRTVRFGDGVEGAAVPDDEALAAYYRGYGGEMGNRAEPGTSVPEAEPLGEEPWPPDRPPIGPVVLRRGTDPGIADAIREAADCRRCHLWEPATQTVFGEGPAGAPVMFVGEQPGDQEDVIGRPFVGPAGHLLDRALIEAGIDRRTVYVTNAVKHFKFTPRGKRRIHQTPDAPEIQACRFWMDVERVQLAPKLVVAMGGTAARAVLGRPVTIGRERGRAIALSEGTQAFVTVHPSFLLRVPDEEAKKREYPGVRGGLAGDWEDDRGVRGVSHEIPLPRTQAPYRSTRLLSYHPVICAGSPKSRLNRCAHVMSRARDHRRNIAVAVAP